jgi:hypothetical protein
MLENPYGKNQPIIDILFPLTKPDQVNQPPSPDQVSLHLSTLDTLQWSILIVLKASLYGIHGL